MKSKKIRQYLAGIVGCIALAACLNPMWVNAGSSKLIVDKSSFETELDTSLWHASDERVKAENGKLIFTEESKSTTTLIAKIIAKHTDYHDYVVKASASMNLSGISEDGTFAMGLGLGSIEATMGEPENIEIRFTRENGGKAAVVVFDKDGEAKELAATSVSLGSSVNVNATISAESVLNISLNGRTLCNQKIETDGEGRVGFLQTGGCAVSMSDVSIEAYSYDRPENTDIYEDFERESININELTANMVYTTGKFVPYGMEIREIDGNRAMVFENMSVSYLGSMYKYSNFEITFDVLDMQRVAETDEEGNVLVPKNDNIAISFGDEAQDYTGYGYTTSTDVVVFNNKSQIASANFGHVASAADKGIDFYASDCDRDFSIRLSMIDGTVTASVKWIDQKEFTPVLTYKVSDQTPLGYVHIWTTGSYTNFAIDNLTLLNKDQDPNLIEVDFKSAVYEVPEDFKYEKIGFVYREDAETKDTSFTFSPYYLIPAAAVLCGIGFAVVTAVSKKRKGEPEDAETKMDKED